MKDVTNIWPLFDIWHIQSFYQVFSWPDTLAEYYGYLTEYFGYLAGYFRYLAKDVNTLEI